MKLLFTSLFTLFLSLQITGQTFSGTLKDPKTGNGIPYATIEYGKNKGVISNEEGTFSFILEENTTLPDSIYISSMGYQKKGFTINQFNDSIIYLSPKAIELSGVYLFDKELSADDIVEKMIENLPTTVNNAPIKQRYFLRQSVLGAVEKIDFGFEKSSIKELNKELIDSILPKPSLEKPHIIQKLLATIIKQKKVKKIGVLKAAELY